MSDSPAERLENRSLFSKVFGTFFSDQDNTSGLLAVGLIAAMLVMVTLGKPVPGRLSDAALVVSGFYFGGVAKKSNDPPSPH